MGRGDDSDDEARAQVERSRAAVRAANWADPTFVRELLRYGVWRLRSLPGREARVQRAQELLDEAVVRIMDGRRRWRKPGEIPTLAFVKGVMRSVANEWLEEEFAPPDAEPDGDIDAHADPSSEADASTPPDPRLARIEAAIAGDSDLESYYLTVLEAQPKREAVASVLGWSTDKVSVVRKKLRRRLEIATARKEGAS